jgi:hypothetical protein
VLKPAQGGSLAQVGLLVPLVSHVFLLRMSLFSLRSFLVRFGSGVVSFLKFIDRCFSSRFSCLTFSLPMARRTAGLQLVYYR